MEWLVILFPIGVLFGLWFGPSKEREDAVFIEGYLRGMEMMRKRCKVSAPSIKDD